MLLWFGTGVTLNVFKPPLGAEIPRVEYTASALENRHSKHFQRGSEAVNVYKLLDGSYTETHPGDESLIDFMYFGGRTYFVSDEEKSALEGAGYTVS